MYILSRYTITVVIVLQDRAGQNIWQCIIVPAAQGAGPVWIHPPEIPFDTSDCSCAECKEYSGTFIIEDWTLQLLLNFKLIVGYIVHFGVTVL